MDINEIYDKFNRRREPTESEKITKEIFEQSTMIKYYSFGLAQGIAYACKVASELSEYTIDNLADEMRSQYENEIFLKYFDRLINEYKR